MLLLDKYILHLAHLRDLLVLNQKLRIEENLDAERFKITCLRCHKLKFFFWVIPDQVGVWRLSGEWDPIILLIEPFLCNIFLFIFLFPSTSYGLFYCSFSIFLSWMFSLLVFSHPFKIYALINVNPLWMLSLSRHV